MCHLDFVTEVPELCQVLHGPVAVDLTDSKEGSPPT